MDFIAIGQGVGTLLIGSIIAWQWYTEHVKKKKPTPDLSDDDYNDMLGEILADIQQETGAHRVAYWAAQNGEKTLDGHSIKKLSMVSESNADGVDNVITEMQNIPTVAFKRNLDTLKRADQYILSFESEIGDTLSKTHAAYGIQTAYFFKINNLKKKMWTGILVVAFDERKHEIFDTQIGYCQLNVNKIEGIISGI
jgi:hypothetical protein